MTAHRDANIIGLGTNQMQGISLTNPVANKFGKKVLLIDGNFSSPNLGLHVGLINPEITIHHVIGMNSIIIEILAQLDFTQVIQMLVVVIQLK